MKKALSIYCLLVVFAFSGCSENETKKKKLLTIFALPTDFLQIEILPNSAGLKATISYKEFKDLKSKLKGFSPWYGLKKETVIEAQDLSISGKKGIYIYSLGDWNGGTRKVLVYDEKNEIFYALFADGLM